MNSRRKGKDGELELASKFREHGFPARRSQQYCGTSDSMDVIGLPFIHVECKRKQALNVYDALEKAKNEAAKQNIPVVFWRRNNKRWLAICDLDDWMTFYREYFSGRELDPEHNFSTGNGVKL
jgi:Holliday junction resolvase